MREANNILYEMPGDKSFNCGVKNRFDRQKKSGGKWVWAIDIDA
jgi:hypothetical protein